MAEPTPTEPAGIQGKPEPYPALAPAPAPAEAPDAAGYRPLAITAVIGLSLAVLFAAVLVVCAVVGWSSGMPLPLAVWPLLVPLVALVVSALGWLQVQRSEGTRAGGGLAVWGVIVSLFAGLCYGAYLGASFMAIGQQAEDFAGQWLQKIRDGKFDDAFVDTLQPENRPPRSGDLHQALEMRFNAAPDGSFSGQMTTFQQSDLVRSINHGRDAEGGADSTIQPRGVRTTEYHAGGFRVEMTFEVTTPERVAELTVTAQGVEQKDRGRQWYIVWSGSAPTKLLEDRPQNLRMSDLKRLSLMFVQHWMGELKGGHLQDAFLETQPAARREALRAEYRAGQLGAMLLPELPAARVGPIVDADVSRRLYLPGYAKFMDGDLIHADKLSAPGKQKDEIPRLARLWFVDPRVSFDLFMKLTTTGMPVWERHGDRVLFYLDFQGNVFHHYVVDGAIVLEGDARILSENRVDPAWRVAGMELYNGRTFVAQQRPEAPPMPEPPR